ncbi:hypothetical protein GORHZ_052_00150 [Gordonia rhizosphera NBRC 16068]|uniref:DUF3558 domain-containing protein n=2 Tax=Gordonia rhizosphera TaxID=83341 RepID=K6W618_9ACTN|nr:hypothetical protein GORHZ_052_00150 [Gordonia rhizosphera NBRC 16068]
MARLRATGAVAAAVAIGFVTVAGCSSDSDSDSSAASSVPSTSVVITGPEGTATVQNPAPYLSLWDPCSLPKSVPDSVALQDDPGVSQLDPWQFCEYQRVGDNPGDASYGISVGVTTQPYDEVSRNPAYSNVRPTRVGDGHPAFIADRAGVGSGPGMGIGWGTSYGTVTVDISPLGGSDPFDVQPILEKFVGAAYPYVPK